MEVTITSVHEGPGNGHEQSVTISADIEPSFIVIGPYHLALGMNNRVWFYLLCDLSIIEFERDREYLGTIQDISLNGEYCAVRYVEDLIFYSKTYLNIWFCFTILRFDGKVQLHILEIDGPNGGIDEERESRIFPSPQTGRKSDIIRWHWYQTLLFGLFHYSIIDQFKLIF